MKKKNLKKGIGELLSLTAIGIAMSALIFSFDANAQIPDYEYDEETEIIADCDNADCDYTDCDDTDCDDADCDFSFREITEWLLSEEDDTWR